MIDLTDRIISTPRPQPTPFRAPNGSVKWHWPRRIGQILCGVLLVILPLTNGLRLDIRRGEFYFAWHKMAAHDLYLLFWVSMLGVALLTAVSFLYGRLWCGWVCRQTLACDFADSLKKRLDRAFRTGPGKPRFVLSRTLWTSGILAMSLGTGVILACYWLAPMTVFRATAAPWRDVPAALTVYLTATVLAGDMLWLRRRFCAHACPYGALMGSVADTNTLAVRFLTEREDECITCHRCETDCPMGIDIKQGVGQHECIGCGECVDSCNDVLGKRGIPGLIEFRYGVSPERMASALTLAQRVGIWDTRRLFLAATVPLCLAVVLILIYGHLSLSASVTAAGAAVRGPVEVQNRFLLTVGNGEPRETAYQVSVTGLPSGHVEPAQVVVGSHDSRIVPITVSGSAAAVPLGRTRIKLHVTGGRDSKNIATIFYAPPY